MTIKELIEELNKIEDKDKLIGINDADTNWHLHIENIREFKDRVLLEGNYTNEIDNE